jgi:hypothetical protein
MALDIISYLLELPRSILPVSHIIGRIIYQIIFALKTYRGNAHNVNWTKLFARLLGFCNRTQKLVCEYNGYAIATVALASTYRAALFKKDDGYISLLQALAKEPWIGICEYRPPDAFQVSTEFMKKCKTHVRQLVEAVAAIPNFADMPFGQAEVALAEINVDIVGQDSFKKLCEFSECPVFSQFFHIFARQHCENIQALLHYTMSHI